MLSNEEFSLLFLFQAADVFSLLICLKEGYTAACGKCLQKPASEFIVTQLDITNFIQHLGLTSILVRSNHIVQQLTIRDILAVTSPQPQGRARQLQLLTPHPTLLGTLVHRQRSQYWFLGINLIQWILGKIFDTVFLMKMHTTLGVANTLLSLQLSIPHLHEIHRSVSHCYRYNKHFHNA